MARPTLADRHEKSTLYGLRLIRELRVIAARHGLDENTLILIAERQFRTCGLCVRPFTSPVLLRVGRPVRAIICRCCARALAKTNENIEKLVKHERFKGNDIKRARLQRYLHILATKGPFEVEDDVQSELPPELAARADRLPRL